MTWYVYLLVSRSIDFYNHTYVGITTNLDKRIKQHNGLLAGGAKYTRARRPFEIASFIENIPNRSLASKLEYEIKQKSGYDERFKYIEELKKIEIK